MDDDERAPVRIQAPERPLDLVAIDDEGTDVADGNVGGRSQLDLDHPTASTPQKLETGTHGDAVDPGVEPVGVAQPRQVPPGLDECLLDRVARELRVVEDQSGRCVQSRDDPADEHGEGVMIALSGPLDEIPLVHRRPPVTARPLGRALNRTVPSRAEWFPMS